ncbi:hypothetical protein COCCADRAFT_37528 [Bipolaris zeicola 26-R-13]|uniref:ABM domain-containing protein n=1 Tax=Cochliobolus carbonum (strain 26-R-13) TaxID=930089 RepID=W6Y4K2_COCC2|nr:uncharacterized protein COCCADRAFT_37528 [Bipolaris zeicola 26-R-13]EUC32585.1 hypothetical protein COCCADRAFT_37528 [Bipolaris zeicola 26-R-13]
MLDVTTEVVYLPFKTGLDLSAGEKKEIWEDVLSTIKRQPGAIRVLWGRQIEHPDTVQLVIDWASMDFHKAFMDSPIYPPFLKKMDDHLLAGTPVLYHAKFPFAQSSYGDPFTSPVTECIAGFFPADYPESQYETQFITFREEALKTKDLAADGVIGGWSVERQSHEALGEGVEGKLFMIFIGWPDVEAHMVFRDSADFARVIPHLRDGPVGRNMWHVALKEHK